VLRLNPDVIYVSDIRDVVTLQACVMAVQTGHLVIAVVHGPSPQGLIQLMIDLQPGEMRSMFCRSPAGALRAVAMSCLLPAASGQGRLAAYAVLVADEAMRQAIAEGRDIAGMLPPGSQTLAEDVERLVADGKVTEQAAREALEKVRQG
jgi:twitching motility protein PilT